MGCDCYLRLQEGRSTRSRFSYDLVKIPRKIRCIICDGARQSAGSKTLLSQLTRSLFMKTPKQEEYVTGPSYQTVVYPRLGIKKGGEFLEDGQDSGHSGTSRLSYETYEKLRLRSKILF